ncbi:MAG: PQQ-like beta-propeller repeat protein [Nitrospirae bacterium]|nr:PQQ-like beta-propeller repeat protein [Nitrospirota bacterium]
MFQHDLQHTGRSPFKGPENPELKWQFQVEGTPSSPAIGADGTIYLPTGWLNGDTIGYLYAINPDGTQKWRYQFEGLPSNTTPAIAADGTIYVHMNGNEGNIAAPEKLYAINPDGTLKWRYQTSVALTSYTQSSPAIGSDSTIYFGSQNTGFYAVNPDGTLKWAQTISSSSITSSPVIAHDGTVYIVDPFYLAAFSPDGSLLWNYHLADSTVSYDASPSISSDGTVYIGKGNELQAINPDGTLKWKYLLTESPMGVSQTPAIASDGTVYISMEVSDFDIDGVLHAVNPDGTIKWKRESPRNGGGVPSASAVIDYNGGIYYNESAVMYTNLASVSALNSSGSIIWTLPYTSSWLYAISHVDANQGSPIASDGTLYISNWWSKTLEAYSDSYKLTVSKSGTGSGTVTADTGTITWTGNNGTAVYDYNTSVTLTATADADSTFVGWGGGDDCLDGQVTMNADKNCRAIFRSLDTSVFSPVACSDGKIDAIIDDFEDASLWSTCYVVAGVSCPTLTSVGGCSGNSLAISYDLTTEPIENGWFVITRTFPAPIDLSDYTHLRIALRGSNINAHHTFEIKLVNHVGDSDYTYLRKVESVTDLSVWCPLYIDFNEFTCGNVQTCNSQFPLDVSAITRIEIAVSRCVEDGTECESPSENTNVFYLDELSAVDLRPVSGNRLVQTSPEEVVPIPDLRSSTANAIYNHQDVTDLVPAWFDESPANYNTYAEAIALHLFIDEYERTDNAAYSNAANRLAEKLIALQIPNGKLNEGAWFTDYKNDAGGIVPNDPSCTGDESLTPDIDRCSWIGNTGWAVIALARLQNSGIYPDVTALSSSIDKAASWIVSQIGRISEYPGLVTEGMEGNISAYFGLIAAGRASEASQIGDNIYLYGWDVTEQRMKIGAKSSDYATAMDVSGSWGAQFLRHIGKTAEALFSQEYAATILRTTSFDTNNFAGSIVKGYGDIAGPWTMTVEFGAQAAAAGILYSNYIMEQIYLLQHADGSFPGSTDNWYGGTVAPWTTTMTGVAPTAWVYFAQNGDPSVHALDLI